LLSAFDHMCRSGEELVSWSSQYWSRRTSECSLCETGNDVVLKAAA
jgi:hypothetical protein